MGDFLICQSRVKFTNQSQNRIKNWFKTSGIFQPPINYGPLYEYLGTVGTMCALCWINVDIRGEVGWGVSCCKVNLLEPLRSCREPLRLCLDPRRSCRDPRKELCERLNGGKTRNISICADQDQQPPLSHLFHISGALCLHILDRACLPAMRQYLRQYLSLHQCWKSRFYSWLRLGTMQCPTLGFCPSEQQPMWNRLWAFPESSGGGERIKN